MSDNIVGCLVCGSERTGVIDSRVVEIGPLLTIKRRRKCNNCGNLTHTVEVPLELGKELYLDDGH